MRVTENIANQYLQDNKKYFTVGICGRAGAGKTFLSSKISDELSLKKIGNVIYSGDWRFILDSKDRRKWLEEKWKVGIDAYIFAINQLTWWDYDKISSDLDAMSTGDSLVIDGTYNRETGKKDGIISLRGIDKGIILYENCILGGIEILNKLDLIVFVNTPDRVCFERTLKKDSDRRSITDIASRFIITTYSENNFFNLVFDKFKSKLLICDSNGLFSEIPIIENVSQIPVYIQEYKYKKRLTGTIFCDLDGTLVKHVPVPSEDGSEIEILSKTVEKLKKWTDGGYYIVLTTSRPYNKVFGILDKLKSLGIEFDQIVCDLPVGPRYLINDSKNNELRAFAYALERDYGIGDINI